MVTMQDVRNQKAEVCRNLSRLVESRCKPSNIREHHDSKSKSLPLALWHEPDSKGVPKAFAVRGSHSFTRFLGFTPRALVVELTTGAKTLKFSDMPLEDLLRLHAWTLKKFYTA